MSAINDTKSNRSCLLPIRRLQTLSIRQHHRMNLIANTLKYEPSLKFAKMFKKQYTPLRFRTVLFVLTRVQFIFFIFFNCFILEIALFGRKFCDILHCPFGYKFMALVGRVAQQYY